jgi:carbon storage regulator
VALVLTRKAGETIRIGENVFVTVALIEHGGRVRLAIDAPRHVQIWRAEIDPRNPANHPPAEPAGPAPTYSGIVLSDIDLGD